MDGQLIETSRGQIKPITIGANPLVKFIHDNTPMTFKALAKKSGVNQSTLYRWCYEGTSPGLAEIEAVINAMGYNLVVVKRDTKNDDEKPAGETTQGYRANCGRDLHGSNAKAHNRRAHFDK